MCTRSSARHRLAAARGAMAVAAVACCLVGAGPAGAATRTWHAPVDVAPVSDAISGLQVVVDPQGNAIAVWIDGMTRGTGARFLNGVVRGAVRTAGGAWQASIVSSPGETAPGVDLAIDAQGNAVVVWSVYGGGVRSAARPAGGAWQAPVYVSDPRGLAYDARVAVSPAGDAVAVWSRYSQLNDRVVESAVRPAGGAWQPPVEVSAADKHSSTVDVAVDQAGDAVVVWNHYAPGVPEVALQSAVRRAGGSWQAPVAIPLSVGGGQPSVEVDARGNAVAVWTSGDLAVAGVQGATLPAGGSWQPFDVAPDGPLIETLDLAVNGQGDAAAIWSRPTGGVVEAASRPLGGVWQPPAAPAIGAFGGGDVELDPQGNAMAVFQRTGPNSNTVVQSAIRPAGGAWQAPVDVSGPAGGGAAQVAIGPQGDAVALWTRGYVLKSAAYDAIPPPAGPAITRLRVSPSTFRAARSGRSVKQPAAEPGTSVSYTLSVAASVRFNASRLRGGRTVGGRCVRPIRSNRTRGSCTRWVRLTGSFARSRPRGGDRFTFTGRLSGRTLAPGVYRLVATPAAGGRTGAPARARFRVARRR